MSARAILPILTLFAVCAYALPADAQVRLAKSDEIDWEASAIATALVGGLGTSLVISYVVQDPRDMDEFTSSPLALTSSGSHCTFNIMRPPVNGFCSTSPYILANAIAFVQEVSVGSGEHTRHLAFLYGLNDSQTRMFGKRLRARRAIVQGLLDPALGSKRLHAIAYGIESIALDIKAIVPAASR